MLISQKKGFFTYSLLISTLVLFVFVAIPGSVHAEVESLSKLPANIVVSAASDNPSAGTVVASTSTSSAPFTALAFNLSNADSFDYSVTGFSFKISTSTTSDIGSSLSSLISGASVTMNGRTYSGTISPINGIIRFKNMGIILPGNQSTEGTLALILGPQAGHYSAKGTSLAASLFGTSNSVIVTGTATSSPARISVSALGSVQTVSIASTSTPPALSIAGNSTSAVLTYNNTAPSFSYGTFTLKFYLTATGGDLYIPKTIASSTAASSTAGVVTDLNMANGTTGASTASFLTSTADSANASYYVVHSGDTETFTATVVIDPASSGFYQVGLNKIYYSTTGIAGSFTDLQSLYVDEYSNDFHTDPLYIPNS